MSKPQLSFRVPQRLREDIEEIQEQHGIDDRALAGRELV